MFINHEAKSVFIAVPKTASMSISTTLRRECGFESLWDAKDNVGAFDGYHVSVTDLKTHYPEAKDYFSFGFIRNPWDRLLSCYTNFREDECHQYWSSGLREYDNFTEFVLDLPTSRWRTDLRFLSMSHFLGLSTFRSQYPSISFIGRFENLNKDFTRATKTAGVYKDKWNGRLMRHAFKSSREHDYRPYYNTTTKEIVAEIYAEDIERFDYEF